LHLALAWSEKLPYNGNQLNELREALKTMKANQESAKLLPILAYSTGSGWATLGYAKTEENAKRVLSRTLGESSRRLLDRHGFTLSVWRRTELQRELNGGPDGFVYSIGKTVKH
jgi:hypothetical protein